MAPYFLIFFTQKEHGNFRKEFVTKHCLEQHIYASQEKFTQPLVMMVETLRMSEPILIQIYWNLEGQIISTILYSSLLEIPTGSNRRWPTRTISVPDLQISLYNPILNPTNVVCLAHSHQLPPLDSETSWTGELRSKTNLLQWQN